MRKLVRKTLGFILIFSPIITLLAVLCISAGWMAVLKALGVFACVGLFVVAICFGVGLIIYSETDWRDDDG